MRKLMIATMIAFGGLTMSACTVSDPLIYYQADTEVYEDFTECMRVAAKARETNKSVSHIHLTMNCITVDIDQSDVDKRVFRAHVILTALARYGAFTTTRSPDRYKSHAARILDAVETVDWQLWVDKHHAQGSPLDAVNQTDRMVRISEIADLAAKPRKDAGKGFLTRLAEVFAAPTPTGIIGSAKEALDLFRDSLKVNVYAQAYILAAKEALTTMARRSTTAADWAAFDRDLRKACDTLAQVAGRGDNPTPHQCGPDRTTLPPAPT